MITLFLRFANVLLIQIGVCFMVIANLATEKLSEQWWYYVLFGIGPLLLGAFFLKKLAYPQLLSTSGHPLYPVRSTQAVAYHIGVVSQIIGFLGTFIAYQFVSLVVIGGLFFAIAEMGYHWKLKALYQNRDSLPAASVSASSDINLNH